MEPARFVFLDETSAATNMARRYGRSPAAERLVASVPHGMSREPSIVLAPVLAPGDVVVLDNLAAHKVDGVARAIRAAGASVLYLPPYSPDLNPIEQVFAKLKALLRKAAARTRDGLWSAIGQLLDRFPPAECANYLRNCGYGST